MDINSPEFDDLSKQEEFEEKLTTLHRITRELMEVDDSQEICEIATTVAVDLLDISITTVYIYNDCKNQLEPAAITDNVYDLFGEPPIFDADSKSLAWENFQNSTSEYYPDLQTEDKAYREETPLTSELQVPLNNHGMFLAATVDRQIDDDYGRLKLAEILAANVEVALERAERMEEIENTQQELQDAVEELEQSNAELEQFAYVASHDLQEPLRMISSYIDLIEMELDDDAMTDELDEYMDFITDGANRMKQLIDDLLKYSRVETSEQEFAEIDLNNIVENVIQDLKFRIDETDGEVDSEDLPTVTADEGQMTQLFQNLISNALKYASENSPPTVKISVDDEFDDSYRIAIEDNGEGIPEDQQDRIFEVFTRGADEDDDTGTGIGLAVCNRIVDGHGGTIDVESTSGKGTTFYFTLTKDGGNR